MVRVLLRKEIMPEKWASSFVWIFDLAKMDPNPAVVVAFLDYLLNPETMSPFTPIPEFYLNTARIQRPVLPEFSDGSEEGFMLAEYLWKAMGSPSRYNPQLRKLLFLLYKQLFGTDVPKVYGSQLQSVGIVRMNFDGTPLELYLAMVGQISMLHPR